MTEDNLDLFNHIFALSLGGRLHLAPLSSPQRILDIGTGTGIWAIDIGDAYPSAHVTATDLSPIQPEIVPPNVHFEVDDFNSDWTFTPSSFDYIHARSIYGCVPDYQALYSEVLNALKPGAWFEQAEISVIPRCDDGSIKGTYLEKWGELAIECGQKFGKSFSIAEDSESELTKAGFENVTYRTFRWPIGTWPKEQKYKMIGAYNRIGWEDGIEGWAMFLFTNYLGWRKEEVQVLIAGIRKELRDPSLHGWQYM
jgi:ubiquinone/menaquinone biosynthesis C-methylase UbiE